MNRPTRAVLLAVGLIVLPQPPVARPGSGALAGQSLDLVEELARDGRAGQARDVLARWWDGEETSAGRADRQRAIWLRALLEVDPDRASLDYRRLAVEYPGGACSAGALARLAGLHRMRGETALAADAYETLLRDYRRSAEAVGARRWMDEHRGAVASARSARRSPLPVQSQSIGSAAISDERTEPTAVSEDSTEFAAVVEESIEPAVVSEESIEPSADPQERIQPAVRPEMAPEPARPGEFTVQLGAFSDESRAIALLERARDAGFEGRLVGVAGNDLFRVRVGRFPNPEDATRAYDRLVASGFEALVVVDAGREEVRR